MSYDIRVRARVETGREEEWHTIYERNFTYNNGPALDAAGLRLRDLHGKTCGQVVEQIADVIRQFQEAPGKFRTLEPDNHWGGYDDCIEMLNGLLAACRRAPLALVDIS